MKWFMRVYIFLHGFDHRSTGILWKWTWVARMKKFVVWGLYALNENCLLGFLFMFRILVGGRGEVYRAEFHLNIQLRFNRFKTIFAGRGISDWSHTLLFILFSMQILPVFVFIYYYINCIILPLILVIT